ncbi:hypothetical protein RND81_09G222400 [Saponaria officinalis]|uniref:FRIGIDA-like protein n=1 Tax=Saponaria officinalis TaxID=3572 RepID=A0AAW1IQ30_SAPOF
MASSPLEKTSADLKVARFVVHKLGETFDSFQVHSYSIFSLVEQWRNLQASFGEVNKSLESKVKELESKEREIGVVATKLQNFKEEVELGRKKLEFGEKSLSEKAAKVESRRNELKKWLEMIDVQQRGISEREKVVEVKERELADGLMRVKAVDEEEVRVSKLVEELETREKQIELRENRVDERFKAVELRENRVDERFKELELRGREVKVREEALEVKETELNEDIRAMEAKRSQLMKDQQALDLREEDMDKLYSLVELRENEVNERFKAMESKEKELALREEDTKVLCEELKSKEKVVVERLNKLEVDEKDIIERSNTLKVEEKCLRDDRRALEEKNNEFNVRFASLEAREEEVDSRSRDVEVKERDVDAQRVVLEAKEGPFDDRWKILEVKEKEIDERGKGMELKEKELEDLRRGLELKEKQMNASFHGLQVKQMQMDERCKEMEVREREISERYKEMEVREREICADKLDLKGKQMADGEKHGVEPQQSNKCGNNNVVVDSNGSEGGVKTFLSINGKALQLYLNERFDLHESMKGEVFKMLKSMSNPAEIVLDAVDGFFAPHMTKDGVEFETSVVRSSCLLLLEQLMNLKPVVMKAVKREATIVAVKWRAKMKALEEIEVVVLSFLLLLVTYNLNNFLKKNELRRLCGLVDQHKLAPRLCQRLGVLKRTNGSSGSKGSIKEAIQSDIVHIANTLDSSSAKTPGNIHSSCRSMDANGVRSYLIEHVKEYDVLQDKIVDALGYASDAAKLVLNVCNICVTDQDKNRADVNNTVFIFVLKQLMKLSPSISPEVTTEAKNFADFLKARLKGTNSPVLNYRFLQFLASYKLSNSYHPDELFSYFKVFYFGEEVYRPDENAFLCFALGLAKKIPGIIKNLIDRKKQLSAVKYICVFKLEHTFPPVPLLKAYWEFVQNKVNEKRKEGNYEDKIGAENMEITALKSILICITNFKLESQLPLDHFVTRMKELEKEKETRMSANCPKKRNASTRSSTPLPEKRPRLGHDQQSQPVPPVLLLPFPPGPPPMPPSYGPPPYTRHPSDGAPHFYPSGGGHGVLPQAHGHYASGPC